MQVVRTVVMWRLALLKLRKNMAEQGCAANQEILDWHKKLSKHGNRRFSNHLICSVDYYHCLNAVGDTVVWRQAWGRSDVSRATTGAYLTRVLYFGSPVDCIHWVTAAQLTLLEDEMRRIERVNVSTLLSSLLFLFGMHLIGYTAAV